MFVLFHGLVLVSFRLITSCRQVLEHFNLEIPDGREPTEEEEEIRQARNAG